MEVAMKSALSGKMYIDQAAELYGVPPTTLLFKII